MKSKFYLTAVHTLLLMLAYSMTQAQTYCTPSFPGGVSAITTVKFGTLYHTSAATSSTDYEDFSALADTVMSGNIELMVLGNTSGNYTDSVYAYFDWNDNGSFADPGEAYTVGAITNSAGSNIAEGAYKVIVPPAATLPITGFNLRIRIEKKRNGGGSACNGTGIGQAEDYDVFFTPIYPCAGWPLAGTITLISSNPCGNAPFMIVDSGYTYQYGISWQWEASPTGSIFWAPIPGATQPTYISAGISSLQDYRIVATCANAGGFDLSNVVTVGSLQTTLTSNSPVCTGSPIIVQMSTCANCVVTINGPNNFTAAQGFTIPNASLANDGYYYFTVTNPNCNSSNLDSIYVDVSNCQDSVWPGDVNHDYIVNNLDALDLALQYGKTGYARPFASSNYVGQYCADWSSLLNGVNSKHADCNGDGTVNLNDTLPISQHYNLPHPKQTPVPMAKISSFPDLYFDISNAPIKTGANSVPVVFASSWQPVSNFYGMAAEVKLTGVSLNTPLTITPTSNWINYGLKFQKSIGNEQDDIALSKTNGMNSFGWGTMFTVNFYIPAGFSGDSVKLYLDHVTLVDASGTVLTDYNLLELDAMIDDPTAITDITRYGNAAILPNPSAQEATLRFTVTEPENLEITLTDAAGKEQWKEMLGQAKGLQLVALPQHLAPGIYFLKITNEGKATQTLKWIKQ